MDFIETILENDDSSLESIWTLHERSLSNDLMHTFGKSTEKRFLKYMISRGKGVVFASKNNEILNGFLTLSFKRISMTRFLRLDSILAFLINWKSQPILILKLLIRIINNFKIKSSCRYAELDYFAVEESSRDRGIGSLLLDQAENKARDLNLKGISTITSNKRLLKYYLIKKSAKLIFKFHIFSEIFYYIRWEI
tara:strand:- start:1514 stop:2098 length:585 start_codon:yes stop_codon:yes gene_type:complete